MVSGLYVIIETVSMITALSVVTVKRDLLYFALTPFMIMYRTLHGVVRFKGYLDFLLKREARW